MRSAAILGALTVLWWCAAPANARAQLQTSPFPQQPPPAPLVPDPGPTLLESSSLSIGLTIRLGEAEDSGWDDAVRPLGYDNRGPTWGGEVTVEGKIGDGALWLGGTLDSSNRIWDSDLGDLSGASGVGLLAHATLRLPLSHDAEFSLRGGAGGSIVLVSLNGLAVGRPAGRLQGSLGLAFAMGDSVLGVARLGYDLYRTGSVNDYDQGVSLGGFFLSMGVELRQ